MQIKERHNKIQLLRAEYIPEKKRSQAKQFASFDASIRDIHDVPADVRDQLSGKEEYALEKWLVHKMLEEKTQANKEVLDGLAPTIYAAAKIIGDGHAQAKMTIGSYVSDVSRSISELRTQAPRLAAHDLPHALRAATKAIESDQAHNLIDNPAELIEALNGLKKALRKRGIRITPEKPKQPEKPENEPELAGLGEE